MFENEQLTTRLTSLFGEAKRALDVEGRYLAVGTAQKVARLLGGMALVAILIFVGGIVLLFASFALAYWLSDVLGSMLLGFGAIALALALLCCLIYSQRQAWILEPVLRAVAGIFVAPELAADTAALRAEDVRLAQERELCHTTLRTQTETLMQPAKQAASRWETASNVINTALAVYEGLRMGRSTLTALRRVFGRGK